MGKYQEVMKKPFSKDGPPEDRKKSGVVKDDTALTDPDYQLKKLFKKGVNLMADEKLEEATVVFEQALRLDPNSIEILLKLGYARFHLDDHAESLRVYDRVLDIDVTNPEAWNLKGLVHYEQKNYAKALDCMEKAIETDPTYDMAWYNRACFLSLLNKIPESIEALKRSIEIDVKNARKAVKDKDFVNVRVEEGVPQNHRGRGARVHPPGVPYDRSHSVDHVSKQGRHRGLAQKAAGEGPHNNE